MYSMRKKTFPPPCLTTVDIIWSRMLCDRCVTVARPSFNRSMSAVGLYCTGWPLLYKCDMRGATQLSRMLQWRRVYMVRR